MNSALQFASGSGINSVRPGLSKSQKRFNRKHKFNVATKHCLGFCITGNCAKGANCPFVHDVDKIAICKKFLQGKCKLSASDCRLSHNPTPDKMPDCNFFLKGCCKIENCSYRHVKVSENAVYCLDFIKGFCSSGAQCPNSHLFLCHQFNGSGKCSKGEKCTLAHHQFVSKKQKRQQQQQQEIEKNASKFKKVNDNLSKSTLNQTHNSMKNKTKESGSPSKFNWTVLNGLLTKRLKNESESNQQIVSTISNDSIDNCSDFIRLSSDFKSNESKRSTIDSINVDKSESQSLSNKIQSKTNVPVQLKRKFFLVDSDEEKLIDYLNSETFSANANMKIRRPRLKIIPDFLADD